jgi:Leucine-rich repeat (LRR) protein
VYRSGQGAVLKPGASLLSFAILLLLAVSPAQGQGCSQSVSGIAAWWPGDGSAADIVGTNSGTLQGGATASAPGVVGSAFSFDGTNNFVAITNSAVLRPTNFTIEAWIRFSGLDSAQVPGSGSPAGDQYIIFKQNTRSGDFEGIDLSKTRVAGTGDVFRFEVTSAAGVTAEIHSSTVIATGVWYHVAVVRGASFTQIFINGQLETQTNVAFAQDYGTLPLYFGTSGQSFWDHRFKGTLDEVSLYNRPLSSTEIAAIYAAGASGKCKNPGITSPPQGQTNVAIGSTVSFSVTATGVNPLSYQWRFNGANISAATATNLIVSNVQPSNGGSYTVVVTNSLSAVTSDAAVLTVGIPPSISSQPQSRTNLVGSSNTFSAVVSGSPAPAFQWRFNGASLNNATNSSLTLTGIQTSDQGSYTVVASNSAGSITSSVATLTVWLPPSILVQPQSQTVLIGTNVTFTASASGTPAPGYQWQFNGNPIGSATGSSLLLTGIQPSDGGNYSVVASSPAGSITSLVATLTVWVPPSMTLQPQSQTNLIGTNVIFTASASGTPAPGYQWQFNGNPIGSATGSSLLLTGIQPSDGGNYSVVASSPAGSITSSVATLTVWIPPSITLQPQSQTNIIGTNVTFSATASGTPAPGYQWLFNGNPIGSATGSSLPLTGIQPSDGGNYAVVASSAAGSITSAVATLTVWVPPAVALQPQSQTNIIGSNVTFTASASGNPVPGYQWQFNGGPLSGATGSSLLLTGIQPSSGGSYSVVASNAAGSITSAVATLTVWVPPSITLQPQSQTNIVGSNVTFTASASGNPVPGYQWQFNGSPINGATGSSLLLPPIQPSDGGNYSVVASSAAGAITSLVATLTVWVPPSITLQPQSQTNVIGTDVVFSATASGAPSPAYQWQLNGAPISGATASSLLLPAVQPGDGGSYTLVASNAAGSITSAVATLTVWVPPSISVQPQSQTNLIGSNVLFAAAASGNPPAAYQWQFNGNPISGATVSSLALTGIQTSDAGSYSVVASNAAGSIASAAATLTVWIPPSITLQPQSQTNIIGTNVTLTAGASGTPAPGYQWQFNGTPIPGASTSALTFSSIQPSNGGNYTLVASSSAGSITSAVASLTVWVPPAIGLQPQSQTNITGTLVSFNVLAAGNPSPSFQWQFNGTNLGNQTGSALSIPNVQLSQSGTYQVILTNSAGALTSSPASLLVIEGVGFCDRNLEDIVRAQLSKPAGILTTLDMQGLRTLSAFDSHITSLCGLERATNLTTINLGNNSISDISVFTNHFRVTNLFLYHNQLTNLSALGGLTNLTFLDLRNNPAVTTFAPLSALTNLSTLHVGGNALGDVAFVQGLSRLSFLGANNNSITNLSPLLGRTNLTGLDVGYNPGTDVQTLSSLTNLRSLYLSGVTLTNVGFLVNLPGLTNLSLHGNFLADITPISSLMSLNSLDLSANPGLPAFSPLSGITNLQALWLNDNQLSAVSFLQPLGGLSLLDLHGNTLFDLSPLASLGKLTRVNLENNRVTNTTSLAGLTNLVALSLGGNSISNLVLPPSSPALASLSLFGNRLTSIPSLAGFTSLSSLDVGGNPLTNASGVTACTNLTSLSLYANSLTNISFLASLFRLSSLDLHSNSISSIAPLASVSNISTLNLSGNLITDLTPLSSISNLSSLDVSLNPLAGLNFTTPNLSVLAVRGNLLADLGFVQNFPLLSSLDLTLNRITNATPLSSLTNLHSVLAGYNRLKDMSTLAALPRLGIADVRTNLIDFTVLSQALAVQTLSNRLVSLSVTPQNQPPTISLPDFVAIAANATSPPITFGVSDDVTPVPQLVITASSSNPALIPNANIVIGITNGTPYLRFTPLSSLTGTAQITVTVTDDTLLVTNGLLTVQVITPQPVTLPDPQLEAAVRSTIGKPSGPLNSVDLLNVTHLAADSAGITNISGLEWATNITFLSLNDDSISAFQPIQNLRLLVTLYLDNNNTSDFSALAGLTNLVQLSAGGNAISNLLFAQNLTRLAVLALTDNRVSDLSPISTLANLTSLFLDQNVVSNLQTLLQLPSLSVVNVSYNILDISTGSAARSVITNLEARGVVVLYSPQRVPPSILAPAKWLISQGVVSALSVGVSDSLPPSPYTYAATSSNSTLIPPNNLQWIWDQYLGLTLLAMSAPNQAGTTTLGLTVTDKAWLSTTTPVQVTVIAGPLATQLFGNSNLVWSSFGDAFWFGQTAVTHSGATAAQSGHVNNSEESWLRTFVVGPGRLSFWWKVSSELNYDFLQFYINGVFQSRISGTNVDWQQQVYNISPGTNTLAWGYVKDDSVSLGVDAGWLDQVTYTPSFWLEIVPTNTIGQAKLILHGAPGRQYSLQTSTNLSNWTPVISVTPTNSSTIFIDTGATNRTKYYRLQDLQSSIWLDTPTKTNAGLGLVASGTPDLPSHNRASTNPAMLVSSGTVTTVPDRVGIMDGGAIQDRMRRFLPRSAQG